MVDQKRIVLTTINARYIHSAFGLRYLYANMHELQQDSTIVEFTLETKIEDAVEQILQYQPEVIGLGVYVWNVIRMQSLVAMLKVVAPDVKIVLGGPEVSYEMDAQPIVEKADFVITGWGDLSFYQLCRQLLDGEAVEQKIIAGLQPKLSDIQVPYQHYSDDDIANRIIYVEASRGCPFKCEFCLSALDKTAWPFDLEMFLQEMANLYERGARHFKFVDRTFNLKIKNSLKVLDFFLERMSDDLFLHFEVIPDHLPLALKEKITEFPAGSLQFEIGIQTFDPDVQSLISRRQDNDKAKENLQWIRQHSNAHIHADLIFGLPGETMDSFADSFKQLYALQPHEIQVGILKRLKGSPIIRHSAEYQLVFNPEPPFNILSNRDVSFAQVQFISRFARYWDLIGNTGRFSNTLPILLEANPFAEFSALTQALYARTGQTHKIALLRLFDLVFDIAVNELGKEATLIYQYLEQDFIKSGLKSIPKFMINNGSKSNHRDSKKNVVNSRANARQKRHTVGH